MNLFQAARAYDAAAIVIRGPTARTNFTYPLQLLHLKTKHGRVRVLIMQFHTLPRTQELCSSLVQGLLLGTQGMHALSFARLCCAVLCMSCILKGMHAPCSFYS